MSNKNRILFIALIMAGSLLLDRLTKVWAIKSLMQSPTKRYLWDFFRLDYAENKGAFLSFGSSLPESLRYWLLTIFPVAFILGLAAYVFSTKTMDKRQTIAFSLILAGGAGNIFDRVVQGYVVDFMNMGFPNLRTGIFNFADVSIMVGLFFLLPLQSLKKRN